MDVQEEKYRRVMGQYRPFFSNLICENPISPGKRQPPSHTRNLKYIATKALLADHYPYHHPIYPEYLQEIKHVLTDRQPEVRALALRIGRTLPFLFRVKLIQAHENEIVNLATQKEAGYGYEIGADLSDLLLSVFDITSQSEDIYFDVNQRVITIFSRFLEASLAGDKSSFRNGCEVLRSIFCHLGYSVRRGTRPDSKLISKLLSTFFPASSFVNMGPAQLGNCSSQSPSKNNRIIGMVLKCRQLECRVRVRQLLGFCSLISYLPQPDCQLLDLLARDVLSVVENISDSDVVMESFSCLASLVAQEQPYYLRNQLLKRWLAVTQALSFKKEYLEFYVLLLNLCCSQEVEVPQKMGYSLAIQALEVSRHIQQQFSRFLIYNRACQIIVRVSRRSSASNPDCNLLLQIFQYDWFIDRINQENDLFKSEFLISLLHHAVLLPSQPSPQHLLDLLDIAHRLIDWKCTSKEETHIPTLKFAFDMYLVVLGWACSILEKAGGEGVQRVVEGLINRCNDPNIYFLFKFKLIGQLLEVGWYKDNFRYLGGAKLNFQFIEEEVRVVMMPKNPKPIFSYDYSLTFDGEVQSRKELEYIKIIVDLLNKIPLIHEGYKDPIDRIILDYHAYLNDLERREEANKELINCLQTLQADCYFTPSQHSFLLAALPSSPHLQTLNFQTNLQESLLFSSAEAICCQDDVNIFGPMSPVQLSIRMHPHPSFSSVYIHVKKNQWVQAQNQLKLVVSSGLEKKELPFESCVLEIKVDRIGLVHFEVWKGMQNDQLLGSGSYRIKRRLRWLRVDHLRIVDGIHTKAYFKESQNCQPQSYLSSYYGQPLMVHISKQSNEVVIGVPNKDIWNETKEVVSSLVQELYLGTAEVISPKEDGLS